MTKAHFTGNGERNKNLLELIHTDVCGPMSINVRGKYQYFMVMFIQKHKSESFEKFKDFQNDVQNKFDTKIKALRSDRGGEYLSQSFDDHLRKCGIVSQLTPPVTPRLNGVFERRN